MLRIAAYPLHGEPYTECFYEALRKKGVAIADGKFSIRWLIKEVTAIDYFHLHWPSMWYAYRDDLRKTVHALIRMLVYLAIIRIKGKRIIWTAHNLYPHEKGGRVNAAINVAVRHALTQVATLVLVHGPAAAKIVAREFPASKRKLLTIDHGHFVNSYRNEMPKPLARKKLGIPDGDFVFLFIGKCRRYKNIHELIPAFRKISGAVRLLVVGKFHEESYRREIGEIVAEQDDRITMIPKHIADDDLQMYLNASDAVVLPYSEILTSGAAMLAISYGRPVIAPNTGYLTDVINSDCGLLYEGEDPNGLLEAMMEVQNKSFDEQRIIKHALTYDWDSIADIVYARIAESGP